MLMGVIKLKTILKREFIVISYKHVKLELRRGGRSEERGHFVKERKRGGGASVRS